MNENVEDKIRSLSLPQLEILMVMAKSNEPVSTSREIMQSTGTSSYTFGAIISPLRRHKVDGLSLIVQAGKDGANGVRWQINEKLVTKQDLLILLNSMGVQIEEN